MLDKTSLPCLFAYNVRESHSHFSLRFLTSTKISGTLLVVCFPLKYIISRVLWHFN